MTAKKSIKQRAITYARRYSGQSATQIAHAIGARPSTVSAVLYRAVQAGTLVRTETRVPAGHNHWNVVDGGGPGGGHTYGPVGIRSILRHVCTYLTTRPRKTVRPSTF